ncbi:hypothetical protein HZA57_08390 [Candidatus Poribacteria bacterium]|nr:hypothetical protein [Candidatus Poribacteria bacterium]
MSSHPNPDRQRLLGQFHARLEEVLDECGWPAERRQGISQALTEWASDELLFEDLDRLAPSLVRALMETADPGMALRNWDRYLRSAFNRLGMVQYHADHPAHLEFLVSLFAYSQFFADIVIRNPEFLGWCLDEGNLEQEKPLEAFRSQLADYVRPFRQPESRRRALCRFKRRELLRIGIRDMQRTGDMDELCRELSRLAQAACELALADSAPPLFQRYGHPAAVEGALPLTIIAMGKFGGEELNFSSDIDLLFVYDEEGTTPGRADSTGHVSGQISYHEFFGRLAAAISQYLADATTEGVLYRVDTRLRPDGSSGALARSVASYSDYFAEQARSWEKAAYIKARPVAGNAAVGVAFLEVCQAFLFSGNLPEVILEEIARLKHRIDFEALDERSRQLDIKRGTGGIREIEFLVAALQLLLGMDNKALRVRSTLEALARIVEAGGYPADKARRLSEAYWFFRRVEHSLQMMEERQTHSLPEEEPERAALARRCGFSSLEHFEGALESERRFVRAEFELLFHERDKLSGSGLIDWLESGQTPPGGILEGLAECGLATASGFNALRALAVGTQEIVISSAGQRWFEQLLEPLLLELGQAAFPESAVRHLANFVRSRHSIAGTYELILQHPPLLRLLVRSLGYGGFPARALFSNPGRLEEMIIGDGLAADRPLEIAPPPGSSRDRLDATRFDFVREFKAREGLFLAVREILGIDTPAWCAAKTTSLAECCLRAVHDIVRSDEDDPPKWCVLGLGTLGAAEAHLYSDLDTAFFFDAQGRGVSPREAESAGRMASAILAAMSAVTPAGQLWKADARLRPDGVSAPIAATLRRTREYYLNEAGLWEFQSIARARPIAGDPETGARLIEAIWEAFDRRSPWRNLAGEICAMRARMEQSLKLPRHAALDIKRSPGGSVDVEFLVQYFQLARGGGERTLRTPHMRESLAVIRNLELLPAADCAFVEEHYTALRVIQRAVRLLWETSRDFLPAAADQQGALARALAGQVPNAGEVLAGLPERMAAMRRLFVKTLGD